MTEVLGLRVSREFVKQIQREPRIDMLHGARKAVFEMLYCALMGSSGEITITATYPSSDPSTPRCEKYQTRTVCVGDFDQDEESHS
jgi:hypothetical protein